MEYSSSSACMFLIRDNRKDTLGRILHFPIRNPPASHRSRWHPAELLSCCWSSSNAAASNTRTTGKVFIFYLVAFRGCEFIPISLLNRKSPPVLPDITQPITHPWSSPTFETGKTLYTLRGQVSRVCACLGIEHRHRYIDRPMQIYDQNCFAVFIGSFNAILYRQWTVD